tara:strand:- start:11622 stop:12023 length:402 start_codon:yes stop_codon:yes gene_type:complete
MGSIDHRKKLGLVINANLTRLLIAKRKTRWWLVNRLETLDPQIAAHATLCEWFLGDKPATHRIPAVAIPVLSRALHCNVADFYRVPRWVRCDCCQPFRTWCRIHDSHTDGQDACDCPDQFRMSFDPYVEQGPR